MSSGPRRPNRGGSGRQGNNTTSAGSIGSNASTSSSNPNTNNRRGGNRYQRGRSGRQSRGRGTGARDINNGGSNTNTSNPSNGYERDEDVLIAFMPYLKGNNIAAANIHEEYQNSGDQRAFVKSARQFLITQTQNIETQTNTSESNWSSTPPTLITVENKVVQPLSQPLSLSESASLVTSTRADASQNDIFRSIPVSETVTSAFSMPQIFPSSDSLAFGNPVGSNVPVHRGLFPSELSHQPAFSYQQHPSYSIQSPMHSIEQGLGALLSSDDDPILIPSFPSKSGNGVGANIWGSSASPITPPRPNHRNTTDPGNSISMHTHPLSPAPTWNTPSISEAPSLNLEPPNNNISDLSPLIVEQPVNETSIENSPDDNVPESNIATPAQPKKESAPPKRVWTHSYEQPGTISVNGVTGSNPYLTLQFGPKEVLTAYWSLPLNYLIQKDRERSNGDTSSPFKLEEVLRGLTIGLFRRGCLENGSQASIITKEIAGFEYWHDPATNTIRGKVPFFSPRTPGNVLFRMYWEQDPIYTLAVGPTLRVRVLENDFESSVRSILSNFKSRKANPTSLSSLHSLTAILETPLSRRYESAARATWGCIQEARKVIDVCFQEYTKTSAKMAELDEELKDLKNRSIDYTDTSAAVDKTIESVDAPITDMETLDKAVDGPESSAMNEKMRLLLSGRASCERKWRDSQLAFASILKSVLSNPSMGTLLRRDLVTKLSLEYELWCPLSEEFAVPDMEPGDPPRSWYDSLEKLPTQAITNDDFRSHSLSRGKMQVRTFGFEVNNVSLEDVLYPRSKGNNTNKKENIAMDHGAVNVFNALSAAMGQYYQDLYVNENKVSKQREQIRLMTLCCVQECGAFPAGTEVAIFGSSANGFGSPNSDIDMCLQLPDGATLTNVDGAGVAAMTKLAEYLEKSDMKEVDTERLTARIPIIKYLCPNPFSSSDGLDEEFVECDLSMHNPLSVINTSFLKAYSDITPVVRVLMSVIKRWAKARDINSPARHTLSSYGYTIMLLHFLTYHKRKGNGLFTTLAPPDNTQQGRERSLAHGNQIHATPLLPNLIWMDPGWLSYTKVTPYRELQALPRHMITHPLNEKNSVNTYYYKPKTPNEKTALQMLFPGQDLSLAILLASFFRYYAHEFDYKRNVVSLHSIASRGIIEREVKAEIDGWRNYSAALAIEDPFELDYDIAHVLRAGYYHRIRREFALAYTKVADAAAGRHVAWHGKVDVRNLSGAELLDWVCEPVAITDKEPAVLF